MIEVRCPSCNGTKVVKHGRTQLGSQRYKCTNEDCLRKTFLIDYVNKAYEPGIEERIVKTVATEGGIRGTARLLGVSPQKVLNTLKKVSLSSHT